MNKKIYTYLLIFIFILLGSYFSLKTFISLGLLLLVFNLGNINIINTITDIIIMFSGIYILKLSLCTKSFSIINEIDKYTSILIIILTIYNGLNYLKQIKKKY